MGFRTATATEAKAWPANAIMLKGSVRLTPHRRLTVVPEVEYFEYLRSLWPPTQSCSRVRLCGDPPNSYSNNDHRTHLPHIRARARKKMHLVGRWG